MASVCGHIRARALHHPEAEGKPGQLVQCFDCRHTWFEHSGALEFAEGCIVGPDAIRLLTPRSERVSAFFAL